MKLKYNNNYTVLYVEDEQDIREELSEILEYYFKNVIVAEDGVEAIELYKKNNIDLVLTDICMPKMDGLELTKQIKIDNPHTPVLVVTSHTEHHFLIDCIKLRVDGYILKPLDLDTLDAELKLRIEDIELKANLKQKEQILKEYKDTVDDSSIVSKTDPKGIITYVNDKFCELSGYSKEELIGKPHNLVRHPDMPKEVFKELWHTIKDKKETWYGTVKNKKKDGGYYWVKATIKPILDVNGKIIEFIGLRVDITESIQSTQLLEEYKNTVDESSIVSKANLNGIITFVNDKFIELSGYTKEELIGKTHNIVRHPDMPKETFKDLWETIKNKKQTWKGRVKNRKKDGGFYWVDATIRPILNEVGEIEEFIGLRNDITEQIEVQEYFKEKLEGSEKNLQESIKLSQEYEKAINESNILSRSDPKGKITFVNDKFIEITGYSKEEVMGKNHRILRHPDTPKEIIKELWSTITSGKTFKGVLKNKKKNGEPYWVNTTIVPIFNDRDEIIEYMAMRNDLTEIFNLHEEIEETQKEVIYKMGEVGETRSKETGNHVKRVAEYSKLLATLYGMDDREAEILRMASPMHDIGKVGIADSILKKPAKLTEEEFEIMKGHSEIGYNVLKGSNREVLKAAAIVSYEHHEKYNGKGYPRGLRGEDIHIYGRITAVADVFDALGSERCYKKAWEDENIFNLFKAERGEHFDPKLIDLFFEHKDRFLEIRDKYKD